MSEYTDQEIVEQLKSRQSDVVRYLFRRYLPMVRLMVLQKGGTGEDAKDIFQDALLVLLKRLDSHEFLLTCKFKTFFYCICENLWKNVVAKRGSAMRYLESNNHELADADFSEVYDNQLFENMFYDLFETLDPLCKKILKLYWQEYSPGEIAKKLGYTNGYVRKKKCECQGELISKVNNHPEYKSIRKKDEALNTIVK